jgi:hypothetical protein
MGEETGLKDSDGSMVKEGDNCNYKGKDGHKVAFRNFSWAIIKNGKIIAYFKDIKPRDITVYERGV